MAGITVAIRNLAQHICNPVHIYCRLAGLGMDRALARRIAGRYEAAVYRRVFS
jgi:hypothetical protein